jgi:ubiquinone/menaquinone biosynthesis C-methylase UbiE
MALEDAIFRSFVIWRICPVVLVLGTIWYYKRKGVTLKSMKLRLTAFFVAKFMARFNKRPDVLKMKDKLFTGLADQKTNNRKKLQILEIGAGGGTNFTFYPSGSQILCLDPNPNYEGYLVQSVETCDVEMKGFITGFAERMDTIEDNSLDAVVCSMVLCSVKDLNKALMEIKRVLKPVSKIECLHYKGIAVSPQLIML